MHLVNADGRRVVLVRHNPIKIGTLKSILIQADITRENFIKEV